MKICANPTCTRAGTLLEESEFNMNRNTCRECDQQRAIAHRQKEWDKRRKVISEQLGDKCVVCGEEATRLLRCHEKHGKPHPKLLDTPIEEVEKNCREGKFIRVCESCHRKAHSLMEKWLDLKWDLIAKCIKDFYSTNPPEENNAHLRAWQKWRDDFIDNLVENVTDDYI
jgi:hypothetical protein